MPAPMATPQSEARAPRRAFLEAYEIPALVLGVARAEPAACRRVLGARRGGRIGLCAALLALAVAAPSLRFAVEMAALHVVLTLLSGLAVRRHRSHTTREVQRLALWAVVTPTCVAALARAGMTGGTL